VYVMYMYMYMYSHAYTYLPGTAEIRCNHGRDGVRSIDHELFLPQTAATAKPPHVAMKTLHSK
jgi:hypothetical protein